MTVLVVTEHLDPTADLVVRELTVRGVDVFRCDAADFPQRLTLTATYSSDPAGALRLGERSVPLDAVQAVYYRRPSAFDLPDGLSPTERWWAEGEARMGVGGVLTSLPCMWLSDPLAMARAEYKPLQLATAAAVGLRVPRTMVTNDPVAARGFVASVPDGAVYKPLCGGIGVENGRAMALYTAPVEVDQIDDSVATTAHLFQQRLAKAYEARVTVVGDQVFVGRIDTSSPAGRQDWRADYAGIRFSSIEPPAAVSSAAVALVRRLGLAFGALDFIIGDDGRWWFLEVNPNGQWAFVPDLREPITAAIADLLQKGSP